MVTDLRLGILAHDLWLYAGMGIDPLFLKQSGAGNASILFCFSRLWAYFIQGRRWRRTEVRSASKQTDFGASALVWPAFISQPGSWVSLRNGPEICCIETDGVVCPRGWGRPEEGGQGSPCPWNFPLWAKRLARLGTAVGRMKGILPSERQEFLNLVKSQRPWPSGL